MKRQVVYFDTWCGTYTVAPKWELTLDCGHMKYIHKRGKSTFVPPQEVECKQCDKQKIKSD